MPECTDEQEMRRLMAEYGARLVGLCTLLLADADLAQDVTQETFIRAWRKGRLVGETEKAWLTRVAVNLCRDEQRSRWFRYVDRRIIPEDMPIPADAPKEELGLLDRVHRLPVKEREVIVMHYWNDMSPEEIAALLSIDRATVFRRLARGRKRLKIELEGGAQARMTEQEFRDGLKKSVGPTGLSSERQMKVLAGMKEGERKVRTWSGMKIALAAGIVLLLMTGVTGAIAGGWRMLDWSGKPLQYQRVDSDRRMLELMDKFSNGQAVSVLKWNEEADDYRGVLAASVDLNVYSFEKLQSWVTADGTLPWPVNIPEENRQLIQGEVRYSCKAEGEFRLRKQEVTEDGYIISCFLLPNASRFMEGYTIYLRDENRQRLSIWLQLAQKQGVYGMPVEDGSTFTELKVDGMLQAIAIESAEKTRVALRQEVRPPLRYKVVKALPDGVIEESMMEYDCLELQITGQGTPAELLAIFGLTAE